MAPSVERPKRINLSQILELGLEDEIARLGVAIVSTPQRLGGFRRWFRCPQTTCQRRCSALYVVPSGLVCRRCAGYKYESQLLSPRARRFRRMWALYDRANVDCSQSPHVFGPKPKYMRWSVYTELLHEAARAELRALAALSRRRTGTG